MPIEITPFEITTLCIEVLPLNASLPIVVTLTPPISEGITTSVAVPTYLVIVPVVSSKLKIFLGKSPLAFILNLELSILLLHTYTVSKLLQPLNASSPIYVIVSGILIVFSEVQSLNTFLSMVMTLPPLISEGITTSASEPSYPVIVPVPLSK